MRTSAELLTEYNGEIWSHLDGALEGGIAFEALKGKPLFNWLHANPEEGARFQRMMVEVHSPETPAIVAAYDFSQFKHIVDVGGGHGMLLSAIIAAHPARARHAVRSAGGRRRGLARRRRPAAGRDVHRRRRVRDRAGGRRRLSVPASAARLRRRRLPQDAEERPPRHEAGFARAGAGEDGADRRHAGPRPLARPARHAADRRPRAHRAGISGAVRQGRPEARARAADRASGGRDRRSGRRP